MPVCPVYDDYDLSLPFDPREDDEPEEEEDVEFVGYTEKPPAEVIVPAKPELTPEERIAALIKGMPGRKKILLGIIEYCREPRSPGEVDAYTEELQEHNYSVYTPIILRKLLEEAGAIEYLEGEAAGLPAEPEPVTETDGDEEFLVVTQRPEGKWLATAAGLATVEAEDPYKALEDLLVDDKAYLEIYMRILRFCQEQPRTKKEIDDIVDDDPLVQKPRRYSGYFVDKLEVRSALEWKGNWNTTQVGLDILEKYGNEQGNEAK
jgi:hypothetical protein